jgi:ABC-2 type transport system permease protein
MKTQKFLTLAKTEMKLSLRSFDMILFGMLMPLAIVTVIGLIYGGERNSETPGVLARTFGAYLSIGICAVGLMGMPLTLADYRHKKVLKRLSVTPAHPGLLLGVQIFVQGLVALFSALLVVLAGFLFFGYRPAGSLPALVLAYFIVLLSIFSLGMIIASVAPDIKKAGLLCSVVYFPMLLFSGTTIPFHIFPGPVQKAAAVLPLSQGIKLLNGISLGEPLSAHLVRIAVLLGLALIGAVISVKTFRWDMG